MRASLLISSLLALACGDQPAPVQAPPKPKQTPKEDAAGPTKAAAPSGTKDGAEASKADEAPVDDASAEAGRAKDEASDEAPKGAADDALGTITVDFEKDGVGGPAASFEAIIGDWYVGEHAGARGLWVDGTKWRQGTPSASLADQAKRLYGEHYAEFLDNVKAFAFYPVAVYSGEVPEGDLRISVRFYPESGRIDQAAGIVWSLTEDGRYWGVRANPLEDNILYFDVKRGKRKLSATIRGVPTPTHTWHTLVVTLKDGMCTVVLDDEERMSKKLKEPVSGRVGLWSKADSKVLFDDFVVEAI